MNEPKKRGRPPKVATPDPIPCPECGEVGRHADDCGTGGVMAPNPAQAYAQRVWDGQSTDLPRAYRLARVKAAVEAQGWTMEGVTL